jgi:hypothetical protein
MHNRHTVMSIPPAVLWVVAAMTLVAPQTATTQQHLQRERISWEISPVCPETHRPMSVLHIADTHLTTAELPVRSVYTVRSIGTEETISVAPQVPAALIRALLMDQRTADLVELRVPEVLLRSLATEGWE